MLLTSLPVISAFPVVSLTACSASLTIVLKNLPGKIQIALTLPFDSFVGY